MRAAALSFLAIGLLAGTDIRGQQPTGDKDKIQGTWKIMALEILGRKELPPEVLKTGRVTVTPDKLTIKLAGRTDEVTYKLDPGKKPKAIDLIERKGARVSVTPGIYLLDGDDLKLCWDANQKSRPKEFSPKGDPKQDLRLFILKREKQK